jgi:hypothetical protein
LPPGLKVIPTAFSPNDNSLVAVADSIYNY